MYHSIWFSLIFIGFISHGEDGCRRNGVFARKNSTHQIGNSLRTLDPSAVRSQFQSPPGSIAISLFYDRKTPNQPTWERLCRCKDNGRNCIYQVISQWYAYSSRQNYRKKKDRKIPELTEKKREIFCINFFSIIRYFSIISFFYNSVRGYN